MLRYQAFLFDLDGTLVSSEPLKGSSLSLACADFGAQVRETEYQAVMGKPWGEVTRHFFERGNIQPDRQQFDEIFRHHYERLLAEQVALHPYAGEFIHWLRASHKPVALVSSASSWMVEKVLLHCKIAACFDVVITRDDVTKYKPDPQAYIKALHQLGIRPDHAVVFEDTEAGIEAGHAAGCDVIAVLHDYNRLHDFSLASLEITHYGILLEE